jgi:hypothetical protein
MMSRRFAHEAKLPKIISLDILQSTLSSIVFNVDLEANGARLRHKEASDYVCGVMLHTGC